MRIVHITMYSMLLPSKQNAGKLESINWKTKILIFVSSLKNEMIKTSEIEYLLCTNIKIYALY